MTQILVSKTVVEFAAAAVSVCQKETVSGFQRESENAHKITRVPPPHKAFKRVLELSPPGNL